MKAVTVCAKSALAAELRKVPLDVRALAVELASWLIGFQLP